MIDIRVLAIKSMDRLKNFGLRELGLLALRRVGVPVARLQIQRIRKLARESRNPYGAFSRQGKTPTILFGPTLPTWAPSLLFDAALSEALVAEGAEVIPFFCNQAQEISCSVSLGKWSSESFEKDCGRCSSNSRALWVGYRAQTIEPSSDRPSETTMAEMQAMTSEALEGLEVFGVAVGKLAQDLISNGNLSENPRLAEGYEDLLRKHVTNLVTVAQGAYRVINAERPDAVVLNDTTYGMWAVVSELAKTREIPVYSYYPLTKDRVVVSSDAPSVSMNFNQAFSTFRETNLTASEREQIYRWLSGDRGYVLKSTHGGTEVPGNNSLVLKVLNPKVGVICPNVSWDAASLGKQVVFQTMIEWVLKTADWYAERPHLSLMVRSHPAETSKSMPDTAERVDEALLAHFRGELPSNISISSGSDQENWLEFLRSMKPSVVMVNTSTAGIEAAICGVPTVVAGLAPYREMSFCEPVSNPREYFEAIESHHTSSQVLPSEKREDALKYLSYYQFRYAQRHHVFTGNPPRLSKGLGSIFKDEKSALRLLAQKIIRGEELHKESQWFANT